MYFKLFKPQDWRKDPPKHVDAIVWCCLKEFRRAETRYDKRDDSFLAFVMVAASCVAFSILHI